MRAKIIPLSDKKIRVEALNPIHERISHLLVDSLQCSEFAVQRKERGFSLPDSLTIEDVGSFLSEYFGALYVMSIDEVVLIQQ